MNSKRAFENYHEFVFLVDTVPILQVADLIVSRAGMGTLTEIAYLAKPAIFYLMDGACCKKVKLGVKFFVLIINLDR